MIKKYILVLLVVLALMIASCGIKQSDSSVIETNNIKNSGVVEGKGKIGDANSEQKSTIVWREPDYPMNDLQSTINDKSIDIGDISCVKDEKIEIHLGEKYDDFCIDEEEIEDHKSENNFVGDQTIYGNYYKWFYHTFPDIYIENVGYDVANDDFDTDSPTYYLSYIRLKSPKYTTDKGIGIGSKYEDVKKAYGEDNLEFAPETDAYNIRNDEVQMSFEIEEDNVVRISICYYRYYPF